jgi:hypothetical protein
LLGEMQKVGGCVGLLACSVGYSLRIACRASSALL